MKPNVWTVSLVLLVLSGCSFLNREIILYPISNKDIIVVPAGTKIGEIEVKKDGYFITEFYMNEVMDAKLK